MLQQLTLHQLLGIHKEIGQATFSSIQEEVIVNVHYTSNWLRDEVSEILSKHKLQVQHYNVLRIVNGKAPAFSSPSYIKSVMIDKKRDLTRLVDKLVKQELLSRKTCPENRRRVDINITPKGAQLAQELKLELSAKIDKIVQLSQEEAELLSRLLDKLRSIPAS